jgi:hypothetical protein
MADSSGRGPTEPLYRVDGQLTDQKPPKAEGRSIQHVGGPDVDGRRVVTMGPARSRPAFPRRPLDLACLEPSDLPADQRAEVVRLVRLVQTDFAPETDPRGWDSVAVLVRGVGYSGEEVCRMGYEELAAIFRTSAPQMRLQKTGSLTCGIATATASVVSMEHGGETKEATRDKPCKIVLREWWEDPKRKQRILEAGSAANVALLIGFSETAVKEAKPIWGEISKHLKFRRRELRELREMRQAEEERLGQ